jgi:hypothetical protein
MTTTPTLVLTVDAARARIFQIEGATPRGLPALTELSSLVNPDARVPEEQLYSDSNPTGAPSGSGGYHGYDDHRASHAVEERKRFAKLIATTLAPLVNVPAHALVCVTHSMHSLLNEALARYAPHLTATCKNIECTMMKPHDLTAMLTDKGLLRRAAV